MLLKDRDLRFVLEIEKYRIGMKRSDCKMIQDMAMIPVAASAVVIYVVVGGTLLLLHGILATPLIYAKTGKVVYSFQEMKKFYGQKKKVTPTV